MLSSKHYFGAFNFMFMFVYCLRISKDNVTNEIFVYRSHVTVLSLTHDGRLLVFYTTYVCMRTSPVFVYNTVFCVQGQMQPSYFIYSLEQECFCLETSSFHTYPIELHFMFQGKWISLISVPLPTLVIIFWYGNFCYEPEAEDDQWLPFSKVYYLFIVVCYCTLLEVNLDQ